MQLPSEIPSAYIAIPLVLIVLGTVYTRTKRLLGAQSKPKMSYVVKWGRERLTFPLPPPDAQLSVLRKQIADYTQMPPNSFKLVHAGAVMKDDSAPISAYGINEKSKIAVVGGGDNSLPSKKPALERRTEENTVKQIGTELDKVRQSLQPDVDSFLSALQSTTASSAPPPQPANKPSPTNDGKAAPAKQADLTQEHARLGELLLQSLLRLDAINVEGEWEAARKERKGAVKEVQGLLDRLDGGWRQRPKSS